MIKKLLFLSVTFLFLHTRAQIINPGFETWSNDLAVPTAMNPNAGNNTWGWWDYNFFNSSFVGSSPISVLRSDTAHGGQYSARIESKVYTPTSYNIYKTWGIPFIGHIYYDTLGILFNGNLNEAGPSFKPGTACTQRIDQFSFWYQYKPNGVDTAECRVLLLNSGNPVAGGMFKTNQATGSTWQQATISLTYVSSLTPDTLYVLFSSSSLDKTPKPGSVMWIDDVAVTLLSGIDNNESESGMSIYPNPSKDLFSVSLPDGKTSAALMLYDINGKLVLSRSMTGNTSVNTEMLGDGVYSLKLICEDRVYNKKVILTR